MEFKTEHVNWNSDVIHVLHHEHFRQPCLYIVFLFFQIEVGSTNIRVGSTIFGTREYPNTPSPSPEKKPEVASEEAAKKMERLTVKEH